MHISYETFTYVISACLNDKMRHHNTGYGMREIPNEGNSIVFRDKLDTEWL